MKSAQASNIPADGVAKPLLTTLASTVYERLRDDILAGTLAPDSKLRIEFLGERYNTGTSPMREALNRLLADGLVRREEQRGFFVAPVSPEELIEFTKTRCWVEEIALRESIANGGDDWEERILIASHRLLRVPRSLKTGTYESNPEWERRHVIFHQALLSACGSRPLLAFCDQLQQLTFRYRQLAAAKSYPRHDEQGEHASVVKATLARDATLASRLLTDHYRHTTAVILSQQGVLNPDVKASKKPRSRSVTQSETS